jgi:hypothetical protein
MSQESKPLSPNLFFLFFPEKENIILPNDGRGPTIQSIEIPVTLDYSRVEVTTDVVARSEATWQSHALAHRREETSLQLIKPVCP